MKVEQLLQHMSDAFMSVDAEWRVTRVNPRMDTLLRRPAREIVGCSLWSCLPDLEGSMAADELQDTMRGTLERRIEHFSASRYAWYEMRAVPSSERGGPDRLLLFIRDVTDRARQMKSEAVQAALRQTLEDAPIAVAVLRGPEFRYELVNAALRQLVGGRDLEGRTIRAAFPELEGTPILDSLENSYRTGQRFSIQSMPIVYDRLGDGTFYEGIFDLSYQPLFETDGSVSGLLLTAVEATPARQGQPDSGEEAPAGS